MAPIVAPDPTPATPNSRMAVLQAAQETHNMMGVSIKTARTSPINGATSRVRMTPSPNPVANVTAK